jgi:hypothetical protein
LLTLTEEACRRTEESIVTLDFAPGSVLSVAIALRAHQHRPTPIREALQHLSPKSTCVSSCAGAVSSTPWLAASATELAAALNVPTC